jgi:hypothetical protein
MPDRRRLRVRLPTRHLPQPCRAHWLRDGRRPYRARQRSLVTWRYCNAVSHRKSSPSCPRAICAPMAMAPPLTPPMSRSSQPTGAKDGPPVHPTMPFTSVPPRRRCLSRSSTNSRGQVGCVRADVLERRPGCSLIGCSHSGRHALAADLAGGQGRGWHGHAAAAHGRPVRSSVGLAACGAEPRRTAMCPSRTRRCATSYDRKDSVPVSTPRYIKLYSPVAPLLAMAHLGDGPAGVGSRRVLERNAAPRLARSDSSSS